METSATWKYTSDTAKQESFDTFLSVLRRGGFSSGIFYYEVQVKGKTELDFGVAREPMNRKGMRTLSPEDGSWILWLRNGNEYMILANLPVSLSLRE
jgi:tripartite motif-containing protein 39